MIRLLVLALTLSILASAQVAMGGNGGRVRTPVPKKITRPAVKPAIDEGKRFADAVNRLSPKERKKLAKAMKKMTPDERRQVVASIAKAAK